VLERLSSAKRLLKRLRRGPQRGAAAIPPAPRARPTAAAQPVVTPPAGARNLVVVVLDSLRFDAWTEVQPPHLAQLGPVERRWSYASWTAPSHYNLLMGLLPHTSPHHVYASEHYKEDFRRYEERLNVDGIDFSSLLPSLFLPTFLRRSLGYRTGGLVSMPVLNETTVINRDFDTYSLMPNHFDFAGIIDRLTFDEDRPSFWMLNIGETHYPYVVPGTDLSRWPRISGVHGVVKRLDDAPVPEPGFFTASEMVELRDAQRSALAYVDGLMAQLFDRMPDDTWVVVTADHGELFGEDDMFGHGPIQHPKVYEVPFVEGLVP